MRDRRPQPQRTGVLRALRGAGRCGDVRGVCDRPRAGGGRADGSEELIEAKTMRMQALLRDGIAAVSRRRRAHPGARRARADGHRVGRAAPRNPAGAREGRAHAVFHGHRGSRRDGARQAGARAVRTRGGTARRGQSGAAMDPATGRGGGGHDTGTRVRAGGTAAHRCGDHDISGRGGERVPMPSCRRCARSPCRCSHRWCGRRCVQAAAEIGPS